MEIIYLPRLFAKDHHVALLREILRSREHRGYKYLHALKNGRPQRKIKVLRLYMVRRNTAGMRSADRTGYIHLCLRHRTREHYR